jgi:hypothetical protein
LSLEAGGSKPALTEGQAKGGAMATNLSAVTLYGFITQDFESAWNSMALRPLSLPGGGNFMFGRQAMMLLGGLPACVEPIRAAGRLLSSG